MDHTTLTATENLTQTSVLLHVVLTLNTLNVTVAAVNSRVWSVCEQVGVIHHHLCRV